MLSNCASVLYNHFRVRQSGLITGVAWLRRWPWRLVNIDMLVSV